MSPLTNRHFTNLPALASVAFNLSQVALNGYWQMLALYSYIALGPINFSSISGDKSRIYEYAVLLRNQCKRGASESEAANSAAENKF